MRQRKYKMTISRLSVDKLGVKLYDRVSAVIAEIVANCYDADATSVQVNAPMGAMLASKSQGKLEDGGFEIEIVDNGIGMTPDEINSYYLPVGAERRDDPKRGDITRKYGRKVMGRKGVGKLAPFGICEKIEIISSGGKKISTINDNGKPMKGYLTAHLILHRSKILKPTDSYYYPDIGDLDGIIAPKHGTKIKLSNFEHRRVPAIDLFERQLAQRFGISAANWEIKLVDRQKGPQVTDVTRIVGDLSIDKMPDTEIRFEKRTNGRKTQQIAIGPDGNELHDISPGFNLDGKYYPISGWVSYSKVPYRDDLMAGIRIYCRGKIAAQTHIFNLKAGFTGEYDIRSYLVGRLDADWLDEAEDLIRTDRQDILWSHELGRAFEEWGQTLVKKLGVLTREPRRKRAWDGFLEKSNIVDRLNKAFPQDSQAIIRNNSLEIAKTFARSIREDELNDPDRIESLVQLTFLLAPHVTLDQQLREAADSVDNPLSVISTILKTARIAELSAFGRIADDRIKVIHKIKELKDRKDTGESDFQELIAQAPWLINPEWSAVTANQSFSTLKDEFQKFYKTKMNEEIILDFSDPNKRPDFVLLNLPETIELVEIKKPGHGLQDNEMERISNYDVILSEFLNLKGNEEFKKLFPRYHITLVCDKISLKKNVYKNAFEGLENKNVLEPITWAVFLRRTCQTHEDFLKEAEKLKLNAAK